MDMSQEPPITVSLQDQIAYLRRMIAHREHERALEPAHLRGLLITLLDVDTAELDAVRMENARYKQVNAELEEDLKRYEDENAALRVLLDQTKEPLE